MASDNIAREKARIDRGDYGDKVPGFDPGAAPLGTDDEAAGVRAVPDSEMTARAHPPLPPGQTTSLTNSIAPDAAPSKPPGSRRMAFLAVAILVALVLLLIWLLLGH